MVIKGSIIATFTCEYDAIDEKWLFLNHSKDLKKF
jgi:hypothetical protein